MTKSSNDFFKESRIMINPIYTPCVSTYTHQSVITKLFNIDVLFFDKLFKGNLDIFEKFYNGQEVFLSESGYDYICVIEWPHFDYSIITKDSEGKFAYSIMPKLPQIETKLYFTNSIEQLTEQLSKEYEQYMNNLFIILNN
jgi:hypothetical protein